MKFTFELDNTLKPIITIDGQKLALVTLKYVWRTSTDSFRGENTVMVEGYLNQMNLQGFRIDILNNSCIELK